MLLVVNGPPAGCTDGDGLPKKGDSPLFYMRLWAICHCEGHGDVAILCLASRQREPVGGRYGETRPVAVLAVAGSPSEVYRSVLNFAGGEY